MKGIWEVFARIFTTQSLLSLPLLKGYSFSGGKTQDFFKVIPIASSPIEFLETLIEIKSDQDFELDLKNLYKNVSFKKGDLIGIAKLPTEAEITEFKIAEFKRKDAEIARQISLDLNKEKEISSNLTPVTKGQLISKCPFVVIVWTKIPTIFFLKISALESEKWSNHRIKIIQNIFNTLKSPYNHR